MDCHSYGSSNFFLKVQNSVQNKVQNPYHSEVTQSCLTPCDTMNCSLPGSSRHITESNLTEQLHYDKDRKATIGMPDLAGAFFFVIKEHWTLPCPFVYMLPIPAFLLQWQKWVVVIETTKSKVLTILNFKKKIWWPLAETVHKLPVFIFCS